MLIDIMKPDDEKLECYFQQWLDEIQKSEIMISSNISDYTNNKPYKKIIEFGDAALPFLMTKIAQGYFFLNHTISEITGQNISNIIPVDIQPISQQEISRLWLTWWRGNQATT